MTATVAWADRPRLSQSYSTIQEEAVREDGEENKNQASNNKHTIRVDSNTHNIFKELMRKTDFSNESVFLNFLMTTAMSKINDLQSVVTAAGPIQASRALVEAESVRIGVSVDKIKSLVVPTADTNKVPPTPAFQLFESGLAKSSILVQQVRSDYEKREPRLSKEDSPRGGAGADSRPVVPAIPGAGSQPSAEGDLAPEEREEHVCAMCGRDRMTSQELEEHSKHCNILDKYKRTKRTSVPRFIHCPQCGMRFDNSADYKKHYTQYHTNHPTLYTCEFCNKKQAFTDKRHLHKHKKTEPVCQECRRRYVSVEVRNLHVKNKNHDKEKRLQLKSAKASGKKNGNVPTVPPVLDAVTDAPPDSLPTGYSFMSVKLNPLYRMSSPDERLVVVPETANRHGYALRAEYLNPPYPVPPIETRATPDTGEEEDNNQ